VKRGHGEGVETASGDVCGRANQKWMIKMKLSTVLLSSAALLVAGAAYAADLPAKKAAPAAAPTGCAAFGAGYIAIPGGDTCLKISGLYAYLGAFATTNAGTTTQTGEFRPEFTVMSNTELGSLKGYGRLTSTIANANSGSTSSTLVDRAWLALGGFTAGRMSTFADISGTNPWNYGSSLGGGTGVGMKYDIKVGESTVTIGEEAAVADATTNTVTNTRPDLFVKAAIPAGPVTVTLAAVSHNAADSANASSVNSGYALLAKAAIAQGPFGAQVYGGTSSAAGRYTGLATTGNDFTSTASSATSKGSNVGAELSYVAGPGTVYLEATQIQYTPAATTSATTLNQYGIAYDMTVAKNFRVQPEYINTSTQSSTTTNVFYLSIFRDF